MFFFPAFLTKLSIPFETSTNAATVLAAEHVLVPGVGDFGCVVSQLNTFPNLVDSLTKRLVARRPTVLVCAAMQIMGRDSEESPGVKGMVFFFFFSWFFFLI
jgi:imidazoleglycerol phosphate synthase glutamine amidotransferase subunit HisH